MTTHDEKVIEAAVEYHQCRGQNVSLYLGKLGDAVTAMLAARKETTMKQDETLPPCKLCECGPSVGSNGKFVWCSNDECLIQPTSFTRYQWRTLMSPAPAVAAGTRSPTC